MIDVSKKLIATWHIGSGPATNPRMIQWETPEGGWDGFVKKYVNPVLNQGVKRIWLHSPFGREGMRKLKFSDGAEGDSNYRIDEYLCSIEKGLKWNYRGFVDAIKPLTKQGIEVCAYLGTAEGQPEFEDKEKYYQREFFERLTASVAPILDSGCSLSIDSSCRATDSSWLYHYMQLLKARGIRVYIEAVPQITHPHLHKWDMICCDNHWVNVAGDVKNVYYPKPSELGGDVVRMICTPKPAQYPTYREWYKNIVAKTLAEGPNYSMAINLTHFLNEGGKISEL